MATTTTDSALRRKMIADLLAQGSSGAPVQHWTQGLNRLAQGLFGGIQAGQLRAEEQANQAKADQQDAVTEALFKNLPGLGGQPQPMPLPGPQAESTGPAMPVQRVSLAGQPNVPADVPTLEPQQTRGVIQGNLSDEPMIGMSVDPSPVARALQPQMAQAPMQPQTGPQIPPHVSRVIQMLGANKGTRGKALDAYLPYLKPQDEPEPIRAARGILNNAQQFGFTGPNDPRAIEIAQKRLGGAGTNVTIDQRGESEFDKVAAREQAQRFDKIAVEGPKAQQMLSDLDTLRTLGAQIGTGKEAQIKAALGPYAEMFGVPIDGLGEIQAYEAIVNRVAPNLRVPGVGAQSDFELKNFLKSLPSLGNTPQGNELVTRTMEGLYQNKLLAAEIAAKAISKEMSRADAEKALRSLPDPMKEWREFTKKNPVSKPAAQPRPRARNKEGKEVEFDGMNWVPVK
jgi:hypothetical protein